MTFRCLGMEGKSTISLSFWLLELDIIVFSADGVLNWFSHIEKAEANKEVFYDNKDLVFEKIFTPPCARGNLSRRNKSWKT